MLTSLDDSFWAVRLLSGTSGKLSFADRQLPRLPTNSRRVDLERASTFGLARMSWIAERPHLENKWRKLPKHLPTTRCATFRLDNLKEMT